MKRKWFAVSLALMLLLAGCGGGGKASNAATGGTPSSSAPSTPDRDYAENGGYWDMAGGEGADYLPEPEAPSAQEGMASLDSSVYQNPGAKLIRRAELSIQTEQFDESREALNTLVASCGGYFENSSEYGGSRRDVNASRRGEYVVRVPAEKYDQFLSGTGDLGYVTSKDEGSEDIGERYYDTEARLKTQRTKQERLLALLEKAETMEDIIALESALSDVEYQIEQYSSKLNHYDALVDFATINISLSEVSRVTQEVGETSTLGRRMMIGLQSSVRNLEEGFQDFLVWVSYNIFLVVILAAVAVAAVVVGRRELKKRRKQNGPDNKTE